MSKNYMSCAETAKLVRQALKESFPGVKFGVTSKTYSGGASINVEWSDGPNGAQVEAVTGQFEGAYFDGGIDYKGYKNHSLDGKPVSFGANFIFESRECSEALIERAIAFVAAKYGASPEGITVAAYKKGELWKVSPLSNGEGSRFWSWEEQVRKAAGKMTSFAMPAKSATLARLAFVGDDGYGAGTVGMPGGNGGSQAYKAMSAAQDRAAEAAKVFEKELPAVLMPGTEVVQ
jgi:hypothetical protein